MSSFFNNEDKFVEFNSNESIKEEICSLVKLLFTNVANLDTTEYDKFDFLSSSSISKCLMNFSFASERSNEIYSLNLKQ